MHRLSDRLKNSSLRMFSSKSSRRRSTDRDRVSQATWAKDKSLRGKLPRHSKATREQRLLKHRQMVRKRKKERPMERRTMKEKFRATTMTRRRRKVKVRRKTEAKLRQRRHPLQNRSQWVTCLRSTQHLLERMRRSKRDWQLT